MKRFGLIGAAGYIAPKHMRAIKETQGLLVAAMDKFDSIGVIDSYFPNAAFFTEFERFDRHLEKQRRLGVGIDYLSICTPNYLHDAHIRFGLRSGVNVICEKPLVLNPWNAEALLKLEQESTQRVFCILQLRLHEEVKRLKKTIETIQSGTKHEVELTYVASRGNWYYSSWKGDDTKSGGVATNIGIHLFDLLLLLYGEVQENIVNVYTHDRAAGILEFENATVKWFLSINYETLPTEIKVTGQRIYRSLKIKEHTFDFSKGFDDLHTETYRSILDGKGFGITDILPSIELVNKIRTQDITPISEQSHSFCHLPLSNHPFLK